MNGVNNHQPNGADLDGLLRLKDFLGRGKTIPVSPATWWAGVASGRFPKPVKLGPKITTWRASDIKKLVESGTLLIVTVAALIGALKNVGLWS